MRLIDKMQEDAQKKRDEYAAGIFERPEECRRDFYEMLGWPLTEGMPKEIPNATSELIANEDGYSIYRMSFEVIDGVQMSGLFFKQNTSEPLPLVIIQHGGLGTPELISGFYGSTSNYNDMLHRVIRHGVHAFAPQLLLWDKEKYGIQYDRAVIDTKLKRVGSSITAIEIFGIRRILDYFEAKLPVSNIGMVGLSYGGFYTLFCAAADTRIKSAISCAFYNTRDAVGWSDWVWWRSAEKFDDAEVACLVYPRHLTIEIATNDNLFDYERGVKSYERLRSLAASVGDSWLDFVGFEGTHEFCKDDKPIENLIKDLFN